MSTDLLISGIIIISIFVIFLLNFIIEVFFIEKQYRLLEIKDTLINHGKPFWRIERRGFLFFQFYWTEYFEEHSMDSATYYDKDEALRWLEYHKNPASRVKITEIK